MKTIHHVHPERVDCDTIECIGCGLEFEALGWGTGDCYLPTGELAGELAGECGNHHILMDDGSTWTLDGEQA